MKPDNSRRFKEAASLSTNCSLSLTAIDLLRHGPTRMSSGGTAAAQFPIRSLHLGHLDYPERHQGAFRFRPVCSHGDRELQDGGEGQGDRWMALTDAAVSACIFCHERRTGSHRRDVAFGATLVRFVSDPCLISFVRRPCKPYYCALG